MEGLIRYRQERNIADGSSVCMGHSMSSVSLHGEISIPGDKSISHRAVMFGSLAKGDTVIHHFLTGADCLSTISCFRQMGVIIEQDPGVPGQVLVRGRGLHSLKAPSAVLDAGNSGTTVRLMSGILAGQAFASRVTGDASIRKRPMQRIMTPLSQMGADISSETGSGCAPLLIRPASLHGIHYFSPVASAQVKSCILLAGLYADGVTTVTEPALSRNHTELMLSSFGAEIDAGSLSGDTDAGSGASVSIRPADELYAQEISVPGDISSAAYFIAGASILPGSEVLIRNVGINPTRDGILRVCRMMGADVTVIGKTVSAGEPCADLLVRYAPLHGCEIAGDLIPALIDELPVITVMAAVAQGTTVIRDAAELKVKESDRIAVMTDNLTRMGVSVIPTDDGMIIHGLGGDPLSDKEYPGQKRGSLKEKGHGLKGTIIDSHYDHRVAMSFAIAALAAEGDTEILHRECVDISYPLFFRDLEQLTCRA